MSRFPIRVAAILTLVLVGACTLEGLTGGSRFALDSGRSPDATVCTSAGMSIFADVVVRGLECLVTVGTFHQTSVEPAHGPC